MPRPTVHDIAKTAGVSLSTVDRVLNERPGVRAKTVARVKDAIERLGYVRDAAAATLARQRGYAFAFVMPEPANSFLRSIRDAIEEAKPAALIDRTTIQTCVTRAYDGHAVAARLDALARDGIDGVAVMAPETPQVRDALRRLAANGVATAAMISDVPGAGPTRFIGVDNVAAGRTAAFLMGRFLPREYARVVVLAGSMMARDHVERRLGFDRALRASFPHIEASASLEGRDDAETVARLIPRAVRDPRVAGVYSLGAGNTGLLRAIREGGLRDRLTVVAHELTPVSREALIGGEFDAVITQDVRHVVRSAIRVLRATADGREIIRSQERIRIEIMVRENLW